MKTLISSLWGKRWVRFLGWAAVWLVTVLVLLWQGVNWYGAREWQKVLIELEKEGETLDYRKVVREPVPAAENFCAIPALLNVAVDGDAGAETKRNRLKELRLPQVQGDKGPPRPSMTTGIMLGKPMELETWAEWLNKLEPQTNAEGDAVQTILARWQKHEELLAELVDGASRAEAQWTPEWKTRELPGMFFTLAVPHYDMVQALSGALVLRGVAAAQTGDASKAHAALQVLLKLNRACRNDALLIGTLVAAAGDQTVVSTIWEVCRARVGTADDFVKLEREIAKVDYRTAMVQGMRGEMAGAADSVMWLKEKGGLEEAMGMVKGMTGENDRGGWLRWLASAMPSGWYDLNGASLVRTELEHLVKPLRDDGLKVACERSLELDQVLQDMKASMNPMQVMAAVAVPSLVKIGDRALYTQCLMDQALIACVLERDRIEHGKYPDSLDGLKLADGRALPMDVMSGKAMGYALDGNGRYRLWAVGWDGKDDGGKRVLNEEEPQKSGFVKREYVGDWVWDFVE